MKKKDEKSIKNVALYLRVSSDKQAKAGDSLREQLETLQDYVTNHNDLITFDAYVDDGISGQKLKRDEFTHLMEDVKAGKIDIILFTKLDRWFRSLRHYLNTQDILERNGVSWTAVSQPFFDTTTAHGRAFVAQSMTWAELEAQNDSERIQAVFENKVKNGEVISGTTPFGYKILDKHLVPDENAKYVVAAFEHYKQYSCLNKLMLYMREEYGINKTSPTYRRSILKNKIYTGEYRNNKEYCEPIIDKDTFEIVQHLLSKNIRRNKKNDYLFSGLIRCGECGSALSAHQVYGIGHPRLDGTRKKYYRSGYKCKKHYDLKICCNKKIIYERTLEKYLLSNLREQIEIYISKHEIVAAPAINSDAKRNQLKNKIKRLKELYVNDLITLDELKIDRAKYQEQLDSIPENNEPQKDLSKIRKLLDGDIEEKYVSYFDFEDKIMFWRNLIREIKFYGDRRIEIFFLD